MPVAGVCFCEHQIFGQASALPLGYIPSPRSNMGCVEFKEPVKNVQWAQPGRGV